MKPVPEERLTAVHALRHHWFEALFEKGDTPRSSGECVKWDGSSAIKERLD